MLSFFRKENNIKPLVLDIEWKLKIFVDIVSLKEILVRVIYIKLMVLMYTT